MKTYFFRTQQPAIGTFCFFVLLLLLACNAGTPVESSIGASAPVLMHTPTDFGSAEPYLCTDAAGTPYLSWVEKSDSGSRLLYSTLTDSTWTTASTIATGKQWFVNWADYPHLAVSARGNILANYLDKSAAATYAYDIHYRILANNQWLPAALLNEDHLAAEHGFVSMQPYQDGFFVSWLDGRHTAGGETEKQSHHSGDQGAMSLRAAILDANGTKTVEWELDNRTCDCCQTSTAITRSGPVVVYRDRSEADIRDMSIVRMVDGKWTAPAAVYADNWHIEGCPVNGPVIDAKENALVIAWYTNAHDSSAVKLTFSTDAGVSFSPPVRVDEGQTIGRVDVLLLDAENALVSWMEQGIIKARYVKKNGLLSPAFVIAASSAERASGFPQMTANDSYVFFAWTDSENKLVQVARMKR